MPDISPGLPESPRCLEQAVLPCGGCCVLLLTWEQALSSLQREQMAPLTNAPFPALPCSFPLQIEALKRIDGANNGLI